MRERFIDIVRILAKGLAWVLVALLGLVVLVLILFYLPPVQDYAVGKVLQSVNSSDSLQISCSSVRIYPPLRVRANDVVIVQSGDTTASVGSLKANVSVAPIFIGHVEVENIGVGEAMLHLGAPDSAMNMTVALDTFSVSRVGYNLWNGDIDISDVALDRPDVNMWLNPALARPDTASAPTDMPFRLALNHIAVSDVHYFMNIAGSIDTLDVDVPTLAADDIIVALDDRSVSGASVVADGLVARYIMPAVKEVSSDADTTVTASPDSRPWTINVDKAVLRAENAMYAIAGAEPVSGLDFNNLSFGNIDIEVSELYSAGSSIGLDIDRIAACERCGLDLLVTGRFDMDSDSMAVKAIDIATLHSRVVADLGMGMGEGAIPAQLTVKVAGDISPVDVAMAFPTTSGLLGGLPQDESLAVDVDLTGADAVYTINNLDVEMPRVLKLSASGDMFWNGNLEDASGDIGLRGSLMTRVLEANSPTRTRLGLAVAVPPMKLTGNVKAGGGVMTAALQAVTGDGKLGMDARWVNRSHGYRAVVDLNRFPLQSIMPGYEVADVTARLSIDGQWVDVTSRKARSSLDVEVADISYRGKQYHDIKLDAVVDSGDARLRLVSGAPAANLRLTARGNIDRVPYNWTFDGDIASLDLHAMGLSDTVMRGSATFDGMVRCTPAPRLDVDATVNVGSLDWMLPAGPVKGRDIALHFVTDSVTRATLTQGDAAVEFNSPQPLDSILAHVDLTTAAIDTAYVRHKANVEALQRSMPRFSLEASLGASNMVSNYLAVGGVTFNSVKLTTANDTAINAGLAVLGVGMGSTRLDSIQVALTQSNDVLLLNGHIGNRPGTFDQWAQVDLVGSISDNEALVMVDQKNIQGLTGYHVGAKVRMLGDELVLQIIPSRPIIGYKDWAVNDSNYIALNVPAKHLDADLRLYNNRSSLRLYTDHAAGCDSVQEDVVLSVKDFEIADWIAFNPYAPKVTGAVSADMRFGWTDSSVNGSGTLAVDSLTYGKETVGSFDLALNLMTNNHGTVRAEATLLVDSVKTITAVGNLNDSTARSPFLLDFRMIHFPLSVLNPFLPRDVARLQGTLSGEMDITGSLSEPCFNGHVGFDSTTLRIPMVGTSFNFSDKRIAVDSNVVTFDDFAITGPNPNALVVNGSVDARHISDIIVDLQANASNMQVIGSKKGRGVSVYGKAFVDLDAKVNGTLSRMDVDARLTVLPQTNITYVNTTPAEQLASKSTAGVVTFVNFADTTAVAKADTVAQSPMVVSLDAYLNIVQGSTINVDLSPDGKNRVQLLSAGTLNYVMDDMGDTQLTGRLNLNGGFVRYTPPFMSEKLFNFEEGSYVAFNGDVLNPYLNVKAVDRLRANVQQEGQNSRLIYFDVILSVTNSLQNMNVAFDLTTDDDITVANELQSMTPTQRANQAMNLLLYNVYTGPGTKASTSLNGNPLFSFLESQVNSWAANNIKGVDLSFGIDQYDSTVNGAQSTTTSYSYKVSKSLFNDRFKISVGGNYSSDADADQNLSQNLINDISFEYFLTPTGNMYVRIFRHTDYESVLEGEVTQTGVGFVYKRRLRRLSDMFKSIDMLRRRVLGTAQQEETAK